MSDLPILENKCDHCNGNGFFGSRNGEDREDCHKCGGSGFVPTSIGARILELVRHNSKLKVIAELTVSSGQ